MCDSVVAIGDDGVLFAKNSDRDPNEGQALEWHRAQTHAADSRVQCTYIDIPQVAHTYAAILSRPWWMYGAEMGVNEHGVAIGNEAVYTVAAEGSPALLGMDLVRLGLERGATAAEAVQIIVTLLERHGQGGACSRARPSLTYHNSFLIADPHDAFVLETANHHHAVESVTHGVRAISNGLTIAGFAESFANVSKGRVIACARRRATSERAARQNPTVAGLIAALREHGGEAPTWSPVHGSLSGPCVHAGGIVASSQTTASLVAHLAPHSTVWATATAAPCTSVFKPVRVDEPVDIGPVPTDVFDGTTLWWRHELFHRRAIRNYDRAMANFAAERTALERSLLDAPPTSSVAFSLVDDFTTRWTAVVADLDDARPSFVRWRAEASDREAGIPVS